MVSSGLDLQNPDVTQPTSLFVMLRSDLQTKRSNGVQLVFHIEMLRVLLLAYSVSA